MERLYNLITIELNPSALKEISTGIVQELSYRLDDHIQQISSQLKQELFSGKPSSVLELEIQGYQSTLIRLMDTTARYIQDVEKTATNEDSPQKIKLYQFALKSLDGLLGFIEQYLSKYFSQEEKVPLVYAQHNRELFRAAIPGISDFLQAHITDSNLIDIALQPIREFIEHEEDNLLSGR
jgi:hypothetical protein